MSFGANLHARDLCITHGALVNVKTGNSTYYRTTGSTAWSGPLFSPEFSIVLRVLDLHGVSEINTELPLKRRAIG